MKINVHWHSEFFNSNFSDSLTTNSTWSQTNNGPIVDYNDATYTLTSNYSGGSSNDYGGSYAYSGGQNWTWSDPNLSTYDARSLSEIRITPAGPPEFGKGVIPRLFGTKKTGQIVSFECPHFCAGVDEEEMNGTFYHGMISIRIILHHSKICPFHSI